MNLTMKNSFLKNNAQVWVETVIYTLIGLVLIAVVLSAALPQIENIKDKETIKQTIVALNLLNQKIAETKQSPSSNRIVRSGERISARIQRTVSRAD